METSQPSNEILVETTNDVSPRTVRTNWLRFSWSQISGATKIILMISITLAIIQIAATVVILAIGGHQELTCDKPLQLYLIVFVVRVGLSLPLSIYQHLFVPRRGGGRIRGRQGNRNRNNNNNTTAVTPEPPTEQTMSASTSTATNNNTNNNNNNSTDTQQEESESETQPSTLVSGWADRLKSLLDLFAILWFIVGNYLIFSSPSCSVTAAPYYYTILTWVLFGYTILVIPLLACASVIFCLPCVLVAMRAFNINVSNVIVGGSKEEIAKIPIFKYKAPTVSLSSDEQQQQAEQQTETATNSGPSASTDNKTVPKMKKPSYIRRLMKRHQKDNDTTMNNPSATTNKYLTIPNAEDAVCSICLSEYENDDLVCKLWCEHHFCHSCITEWLSLNPKCPLCKRDFRGKDHVSSEDSEDEEEQV